MIRVCVLALCHLFVGVGPRNGRCDEQRGTLRRKEGEGNESTGDKEEWKT